MDTVGVCVDKTRIVWTGREIVWTGRDNLNDNSVENMEDAKALLDTVIELYNHERPHMSIGNLTPTHVHQNNIKTDKLWKNYYIKKPITVNR
ncbi:MAG: integrase core domain-containing protein [Aquaticitalea sp.]